MGTTRRRLAGTVLAGVAAIAVAACGSSARPPTSRTTAPATSVPVRATGVTLPSTPAGAQARWLLAAHPPIAAGQLRAHFDTAFLAQIRAPRLNAVLAGVLGAGRPTLVSVALSRPRRLIATIAVGAHRATLQLAVDAHGLIEGLRFVPVSALPSAPRSWSAVDGRLRAIAPDVRMVAARVNGSGCQTVHAIDATTPAPLGSAFKLYVLDALGHAIAAHRLSWSTRLTVTAGVKSLPSGVLQNAPDGTRISVRAAAAQMISISDNTAADLLIQAVGRGRLQASLKPAGMAAPALDTPFLSTRELFILKASGWPALAQRYLHAGAVGRRTLLRHVIDRDPLPGRAALARWRAPRDIDSLEWFASPDDICRAYASLRELARRSGESDIGRVLELDDGGLALNPRRWRTTWFKGGSEPGVLTLSYLATTRSGASYVVSVLASDPAAAIDEPTAIPRMRSAIEEAFTLAAR